MTINTNSSLATVSVPSQYRTKHSERKIDTITIHHMAGNLTVESCGKLFQKTGKNASSNYGIGSDGRIALYVDEKDASWCSSNTPNDERAITIEVANDTGAEGNWHISDKAMESLINLLVDICQRNGIAMLLWRNDKSLIGQVDKQNITLHRWFKDKTCPGPYIESKLNYIVNEVNSRFGQPNKKEYIYRVQCGAYKVYDNAKKMSDKLTKLGIDNYIRKDEL